MKLAELSALKEALTIEDALDLFDTSLTASLNAATETLAAETQHVFAPVTAQADNFFVYSTTKVGDCYRAVLALRQGFVSGTPTVVWAARYGMLGDGEVIPDTEYHLDATLGALIIESGEDYRNRYVRVTYNAGFAVNETDPELYALEGVPSWLQQAAVFIAAGTAVRLNPDLQGNGQGGQMRDADKLTQEGMKLVARNLRYFPSCIRPS